MDFFQFLSIQNDVTNVLSKNTDDTKKTKTTRKQKNKQEPIDTSSKQNYIDTETNTHVPIPETRVPIPETRISMYQDIRRGDFVKIIGIPNSVLNMYKGYIGEIRDYRKNQDSALVFLHSIQTLRIVKFPLYHLVHYDPFTNTIC